MRSTLGALVAGAGLALGAAASHAQYPARPVTLVIPFSAGGDSDLAGRNLANVAQKYLGQPLVPVNRVGASGTIGSQSVRSAAPDGYTMLVARVGSQAVILALDAKAPYRWNDFTMLSILELNPVACVVRSDAPYRSMHDLVEALRASPGRLNYASAGEGTIQHLGPQLLFSAAGLGANAAVHIPYKGGGELTQALVGGTVQFVCTNLTTLTGPIRSGQLRALMVTTPERWADLPDIPTARESGYPQMEAIIGWSALYGPPGLPKEVVDRWTEVMQQVARDPDWIATNRKIGGIPSVRSPAETERFAREQFEVYERLATSLGLKK